MEDFEKQEHALLGDDGIATIVECVPSMKRTLGIYELVRFIPKTRHDRKQERLMSHASPRSTARPWTC
jgi:hypothetical protein